MACNVNNQMIGNSFSFTDSKYRLIVFDHNLNIISATVTGNLVLNSFGGGYFYLNEDNNSVVIGDNKMKCYPTADVDDTGKVSSLEPRRGSKLEEALVAIMLQCPELVSSFNLQEIIEGFEIADKSEDIENGQSGDKTFQ